MHRSPTSRRLLVASLLAVLPAIGLRADVPKVAIAGQRIFYTGHTFHMFVPAMIDEIVKTTEIKGHTTAGRQGIGGSKVIQHWELADDKNQAKPALISGKVDVFTMAPHWGVSGDKKLHTTERSDGQSLYWITRTCLRA